MLNKYREFCINSSQFYVTMLSFLTLHYPFSRCDLNISFDFILFQHNFISCKHLVVSKCKIKYLVCIVNSNLNSFSPKYNIQTLHTIWHVLKQLYRSQTPSTDLLVGNKQGIIRADQLRITVQALHCYQMDQTLKEYVLNLHLSYIVWSKLQTQRSMWEVWHRHKQCSWLDFLSNIFWGSMWFDLCSTESIQ